MGPGEAVMIFEVVCVWVGRSGDSRAFGKVFPAEVWPRRRRSATCGDSLLSGSNIRPGEESFYRGRASRLSN